MLATRLVTGRKPATDPHDTRPRLVLAICCLSLLLVGIDNTIVNVALPSIQAAFHTSTAALQWTIDAYTLVLAGLLMLAGSTADRFGRVRVFTLGLIVFSIGSLACGFAPSVGTLVAARAVQAVGGSMLNPVSLSIIRATFDDARERARAIGTWAATVGVSFGLGPILGGALIQSVSWRAVFWINVPIGLIAVVLTRRFIPESKAERPRRLDPVGQVLVLLALTGGLFGVIQGQPLGWDSPAIVASFAVAVLSGGALVAYEGRRRDPLIELGAFRSASFSVANAIAVLGFACFAGFLFLATIYNQDARHLSPLSAGLSLLPTAVCNVVAARLAGVLVTRYGPRLPLTLGALCFAAGAAALTGLTTSTGEPALLLAFAAMGAGFGLINPPITNAAINGLPASQAGVASALASTSRQVGGATGVAVIGAVAISVSSTPARIAAATHTGWWLISATAVAAAVLALLFTPTQRSTP